MKFTQGRTGTLIICTEISVKNNDGDTNILGKYLGGDGRTSCRESPIVVIVVNTSMRGAVAYETTYCNYNYYYPLRRGFSGIPYNTGWGTLG